MADANYYIDPASVGGNGTTQALTGANAAWKLLSSIDWVGVIASGIIAGDNVILNIKVSNTYVGVTNQLNQGISGGVSNPIMVVPYGFGTPPIIKGSSACFNNSGYSNIIIDGIDFSTNQLNIDGPASNIVINNFKARDHATGAMIKISATSAVTGVELNNGLVAGNRNHGIDCYSGTELTMRNMRVIGNGFDYVSYGLNIRAGATVDYDYCDFLGNGSKTAHNVNATGTAIDGGHNNFDVIPNIVAYKNQTTYFAITCDDHDVDYWSALVAAFPAVKFTFFVTPAYITVDEQTTLAALAAAGHEIAVHSWSHCDITKTTAFAVTTTNADPTINVDVANSQLILSTTTPGNSDTVDWSVTDKTITDLKTAVSGKGWTITNTSNVDNLLKLASLADSVGAQAVPYTANLDIVAPDYAYWREEIVDTKDWIGTITGVTPTTISYPWGNRNASTDNYMKDVSGLAGGRVASGVGNYFYMTRWGRFQVGTLLPADVGATEELIRQAARHAFIHAQMQGAAILLLTHSAAEMTVTQIGWWIDEIIKYGGVFDTFGNINASVMADHTTSDGFLYTKTYSDLSNYKSLPSFVNRGSNVDLITDIDGRARKSGGAVDIGPYEYQNTFALIF